MKSHLTLVRYERAVQPTRGDGPVDIRIFRVADRWVTLKTSYKNEAVWRSAAGTAPNSQAGEDTVLTRLAGHLKHLILADQPVLGELVVEEEIPYEPVTDSELAALRAPQGVVWAPKPTIRMYLLEVAYDCLDRGQTVLGPRDFYTSALSYEAVDGALHWLRVAGLLQPGTQDGGLSLTFQGIEAVERFRALQARSGVAFTVMAFRHETKGLWSDAIAPAMRDLRLYPLRIDAESLVDPVVVGIQSLIRTADLVVVDLTCARPNCYYEAGWAHALGKPVILTVREDHLDHTKPKTDHERVHFDLSGHQIETWSASAASSLHERLVNRGRQLLAKPVFPSPSAFGR